MLELKLLDLNALVAGLNNMLRRLISEDIELSTALEPSLCMVKADPSQLAQVIINLAVNARDAMPGGGELAIHTRNVNLDERYVRTHPGVVPGGYVMLEVSDTGRGMSADTQAHIFEPFFTTKEVGKGTGLGLSAVHGIVKQSGGHIEVQSAEGKGTTFRIYLPAAEQKARPASRGVGQASSQTDRQDAGPTKETVLVVEDEEGVLELVREVLEMEGYTVLVAKHGAEALRIAGAHEGPIELLFTDIVMPEMNGTELAKQLRRSRPEIKLLFASGYTDYAAFRNDAASAGAAFIQKPISAGTLTSKVREVLDAE
jgi:CheY-like chemotaxis protein/two-component sensor histidine kinase